MTDVLDKPSLSALNPERQHLVEVVRRWGGIATDAVLDPACNFFEVPHINGVIGYRLENSTAVVYGNPICALADIASLTLTFENFCKSQGWDSIYVGASESFANWAINNICGISIEFGHELFLDPHIDPREYSGTQGSLVRRKVRHAQHEGTTVQEYLGHNPLLEQAMEEVGSKWLQGRKGPQVHISQAHLFQDRFGKRWFYAMQGTQIVGVVVLNQLQEKQGWLLNHIMFIPEAPHGTPEFLVVTALTTVAQENCHYVSFGNVARSNLGEIKGLGKVSNWLTKIIYKLARTLFHLDGHVKFWEKFHPQHDPSYLLFHGSSITLNQILSLKQALNMNIKLPSIFKNRG